MDLQISSRHAIYDSDNESDNGQPSRAKFKALMKSKGITLLWRRGGTSNIHKLDIGIEDPCASIEVPDCMYNTDILRLPMYTAGICAIISKPNKFTDGMVCVIWGDKC